MKLYFFPGFFPLATAFPLLLTGVGALASIFNAMRRRWWGLVLLPFVVVADSKPQLALREIEHLPEQSSTDTWNQWIPRAALSPLAVSRDGRWAAVGTERGTVDVFELTYGRLQFSVQLQEPVIAQPVFDRDRLYLSEGVHSSRWSRVAAVQMPRGRILWQRAFPGHIESAVTLSPDGRSLFACAGEAGVFALATRDGALLWQKKLGHCDATPVFTQGKLYLVHALGRGSQFVVLDPESGDVLRSLLLPGEPWGKVLVNADEKLIFITTGLGQLDLPVLPEEKGWIHAVAQEDLHLLWTKQLRGMPHLELNWSSAASGIVITSEKRGVLSAWRARDGRQIWARDLRHPLIAAPRPWPERRALVTVGVAGQVEWVALQDGSTRSLQEIPDVVSSAPAFTDSWLWVASRGALWKIKPHSPY